MKKIKIILPKKINNFIKAKRKTIPKSTIGVYFLKYNDAVVYVGQSVDIKGRINQHLIDKTKAFSDFEFIECNRSELDEVEKSFIVKLQPIFNKQFTLNGEIDFRKYCVDNNIYFECSTGNSNYEVKIKNIKKNYLFENMKTDEVASILDSYSVRVYKIRGSFTSRIQQFNLKEIGDTRETAEINIKKKLREHLETFEELPEPISYRKPQPISLSDEEMKELRDEAKRLEMSLGDYVMWLKRGF